VRFQALSGNPNASCPLHSDTVSTAFPSRPTFPASRAAHPLLKPKNALLARSALHWCDPFLDVGNDLPDSENLSSQQNFRPGKSRHWDKPVRSV